MKYVEPRDAAIEGEAYRDENPVAGISGSVVPAKFFNHLQAEILKVITAGLGDEAPAEDNLEQLYEAILQLISDAIEGPGEGGPTPWALASRVLTAGSGLAGGGDLSADRSFSLALNTLTALSGALEDADQFGVYDNSASADRKLSWAALKAAIAAAIVITPGTIPAVDGVGAYLLTRVDNGVLPGVGTVVSGSALDPNRPGNWRCQGAMTQVVDTWVPGGGGDGGSGEYRSLATYLFIRIS